MSLHNLHIYVLIAIVSAVSFVIMFKLTERLR